MQRSCLLCNPDYIYLMKEKAAILTLKNIYRLPPGGNLYVFLISFSHYLPKRSRRVFIISCVIESRS